MQEMVRYSRKDKAKIGRKGKIIIDRYPVATMVTLQDGEVIHFGISRCNRKKDLFNKKLGLAQARERASEAAEQRKAELGELQGTVRVEEIVKLLQYFEQL